MSTTEQCGTVSNNFEYSQTINEIEERVISLYSLWSIQPMTNPNITLTAQPVLPQSHSIEIGEIDKYYRERVAKCRFSEQPFEFFDPNFCDEPWGTRIVPGGVRTVVEARKLFYQELNVNGIVYYGDKLPKHAVPTDKSKSYFLLEDLVKKICEILAGAADFYKGCWKHAGDIEVGAHLRHLGSEWLTSNEFKTFIGEEFDLIAQRSSLNSEIFASIHCCASELKSKAKASNWSLELVAGLLQGFDVDVNSPPKWRFTVSKLINQWHEGL